MLHRRQAEPFMILSRLKLSVACSTLLTFFAVCSPNQSLAETSSDFIARQCPVADAKLTSDFCFGYFLALFDLSHRECGLALEGDEGFARRFTANLSGISANEVHQEFIIRMRELEFRKTFGDLPGYEGIMAAAAARWPCEYR